MKKTQPASLWKPRRLSLNRETIRVLNDPAILLLVRAGLPDTTTTSTTMTLTLPTQESTSQRPPGTGTQC